MLQVDAENVDFPMILLSFDRKEKIINKALSCRGWTNYKKLSLLYDLLKQIGKIQGDILEIGSAFGRSTILFGLSSKKKIWSIDPHTGGRIYIERNEDQNSYEEFISNIKRFKIEQIQILKNTTEEVIKKKLIPDQILFSFAFIDGLHTPKGAKIDLEFSYKRLKKNGCIVIDDYFPRKFKDYAETIDTFIKTKGITLHKDKINKLVFLKKPED